MTQEFDQRGVRRINNAIRATDKLLKNPQQRSVLNSSACRGKLLEALDAATDDYVASYAKVKIWRKRRNEDGQLQLVETTDTVRMANYDPSLSLDLGDFVWLHLVEGEWELYWLGCD